MLAKSLIFSFMAQLAWCSLLQPIRFNENLVRQDFYSSIANAALVEKAYDLLKKDKIKIRNIRSDVIHYSTGTTPIRYFEPDTFDVVGTYLSVHIICDFTLKTSTGLVKGAIRTHIPMKALTLRHILTKGHEGVKVNVSIEKLKLDSQKAKLKLFAPRQQKLADSLLSDKRKLELIAKMEEEFEKRLRGVAEKIDNDKLGHLYPENNHHHHGSDL